MGWMEGDEMGLCKVNEVVVGLVVGVGLACPGGGELRYPFCFEHITTGSAYLAILYNV